MCFPPTTMTLEAILDDVEELHNVNTRFEGAVQLCRNQNCQCRVAIFATPGILSELRGLSELE